MDFEKLQSHIDNRFNGLEQKLDNYAERTHTNVSDIVYLKGFAKVTITLLLAGAGFFAASFFERIERVGHETNGP